MGNGTAAKSRRRPKSGVGRTFKCGLNAIAFQIGGKRLFFHFARLSDSEGIKKVVERFDGASDFERERFDIEAACEEAELAPTELLAAVLLFAKGYADDHSSLLAAISQPDVVAASIEAAKKPKGDKDRKFLFQHGKFIPTPGARPIHIDNRSQAGIVQVPPLPAGSGE